MYTFTQKAFTEINWLLKSFFEKNTRFQTYREKCSANYIKIKFGEPN